MTSVCTGSLVFADAGLLDRRPATTHWSALELLASLGGEIESALTLAMSMTATSSPPRGSRPASTWRCISSRACTRRYAPQVRREIQYDPEPPV